MNPKEQSEEPRSSGIKSVAILRGFPPSNTISPSVRITEVDLSLITPDQSFHRAGLVGFASKGPINVPTLIASQRQLNTVFGYPHPESGDPYMYYAAVQYLLLANELYVVRVAEEDQVSDERANIAEVDVVSAGGQIIVLSKKAGNYVFAEDSFFRWRLNGVLHSKTLVVLAGTYTPAQLAEDLNLQLIGDIDGIEFFTDVSATHIGVRTTFAYGPDYSFEFVSVQDAIYGDATLNGNPTGLGTGMTKAVIVGSLDRYPQAYTAAGHYNFTGLTDPTIQIVIDGTDNVLIDNIVQVIDLEDLENTNSTLATVVTHINNQKAENGGTLPGGWTALAEGDNLAFKTDTTGRDARLLIKPDSTADGLFGLANVTVTGTSPIKTSGDSDVDTGGIINGDANAGVSAALLSDWTTRHSAKRVYSDRRLVGPELSKSPLTSADNCIYKEHGDVGATRSWIRQRPPSTRSPRRASPCAFGS